MEPARIAKVQKQTHLIEENQGVSLIRAVENRGLMAFASLSPSRHDACSGHSQATPSVVQSRFDSTSFRLSGFALSTKKRGRGTALQRSAVTNPLQAAPRVPSKL